MKDRNLIKNAISFSSLLTRFWLSTKSSFQDVFPSVSQTRFAFEEYFVVAGRVLVSREKHERFLTLLGGDSRSLRLSVSRSTTLHRKGLSRCYVINFRGGGETER